MPTSSGRRDERVAAGTGSPFVGRTLRPGGVLPERSGPGGAADVLDAAIAARSGARIASGQAGLSSRILSGSGRIWR